jgi:hypothetical protein
MHDDPFIMIVLIVFIGCATGVVTNALNVVKSYLDKKLKIEELRARNSEAALQEALRHAREEMGQFRHSTNDLILSFDSTLQRLDDRLQSVERVALKAGGASGSLPSAPSTTARLRTQNVERASLPDGGANGALGDGA